MKELSKFLFSVLFNNCSTHMKFSVERPSLQLLNICYPHPNTGSHCIGHKPTILALSIQGGCIPLLYISCWSTVRQPYVDSAGFEEAVRILSVHNIGLLQYS